MRLLTTSLPATPSRQRRLSSTSITPDPTHGQQEFTFYNHHYQSYCYLPLFIFEGTSHALVTVMSQIVLRRS